MPAQTRNETQPLIPTPPSCVEWHMEIYHHRLDSESPDVSDNELAVVDMVGTFEISARHIAQRSILPLYLDHVGNAYFQKPTTLIAETHNA